MADSRFKHIFGMRKPRLRGTGGNRVVVYRNGDEAFPAMLEAISGARSTVCLETYILRDDTTGWEFGSALAERARHGVEVSLMYDAVGSISLGAEYIDFLAKNGVRLLEYHPVLPWRERFELNRRNHRKQLVVDNRIGFVGGLNIADEYRTIGADKAWRDTHISVEGPIAAKMMRLFMYTWLHHGGAPIDRIRYRTVAAPVGDTWARLLGNRRHRDRGAIQRAYLEAFEGAQKQILITNSYFIPSSDIKRALRAAARRGVRVVLLLAGKSDVLPLQLATRSYYQAMLDDGIELYEWNKTVLHAKTAVVDDDWATVGSYNLNWRSLFHNLECNVVVRDRQAAKELETMFWADVSQSTIIDAGFIANGSRLKRWAGEFFSIFRYWF